MLMDQQNIIHKQRETIEKKKHQLTRLKQKHTKTTEELEKNRSCGPELIWYFGT